MYFLCKTVLLEMFAFVFVHLEIAFIVWSFAANDFRLFFFLSVLTIPLSIYSRLIIIILIYVGSEFCHLIFLFFFFVVLFINLVSSRNSFIFGGQRNASPNQVNCFWSRLKINSIGWFCRHSPSINWN